jgi:hypothetical protein
MKNQPKITSKKALAALRHMRYGMSLAEACRMEGIKPNVFLREVGDAVYRGRSNKQWKVTPTDSLTALMNVPTETGPQPTPVHGLPERVRFSRYENAVKKWRGRERGGLKALSAFKGQTVGGRVLITDPRILTRLAEADRLDVDAIYTEFGDRK